MMLQERVLLEEQHMVQRQVELLRCDGMKSWASTRLDSSWRAQRDLREGISLIGRGSDVAMWTLFSVAGGYQHFWRMREARDELLEREVIGVGLMQSHVLQAPSQELIRQESFSSMNVRAIPADIVRADWLEQDKSMRKLLLGFMGLRRAHEAGIGEQEAMKLFNTLAKTHRAGRNEIDIYTILIQDSRAPVPNSLRMLTMLTTWWVGLRVCSWC